jgi:signal transduction histidine kinase
VLFSPVSSLALDQFAHQFEVLGCGLLRVDSTTAGTSQEMRWIDCFSQADPGGDDFKLRQFVETAIAAKLMVTASPYEVVALEDWTHSKSWQFYGCTWEQQSQYYFVCWHPNGLSQHQQYGMTLYAQALTTKLQVGVENCQLQMQRILQRNRHQLRTPLALMLLYVDLLQTIAQEPRSQEWVQNLRSTIAEMHVSLDHLTEVSTSAQQTTYIDFRQSVLHCLHGMQPWIEQKQLSVACDSQPLWMNVHEWKLRQVLQNLLSNAISFAPQGGQVRCEWQSFQTEVVIKISDNGPGLSAEDLRSMGTPFYSRRPGGVGLGLAIAQQIVADHHGSLWGQNLPEGGAQFCITLPRNS